MKGLHFELHLAFYILLVLLGFFLSWFLYKKQLNKKEISLFYLRSLFFFRWLTISLISFFLLQPQLYRSEEKEEKPILLFAQDNSRSIVANSDSIFYRDQYEDTIKQFLDVVSKYYDIRRYTFGDKCIENDFFDFNETSTNIESVYKLLNDRFYGTNITDLVIASDGIINLGRSSNNINTYPSLTTHAILLGDSTSYPDLKIKSIKCNKYTLLNNKFPIEVTVHCNDSINNIELLLYEENKLLEKRKLNSPTSGIKKVSYLLTADSVGIKKIRAVIKSELKEKNQINNSKYVQIEVIDRSQKVLILAESPHPDIAALNWALQDQLRSEVSTFMFHDFDKSISKYDLVIFHKPFQNNKLIQLMKDCRVQSIPTLVITGNVLGDDNSVLKLLELENNIFKGQTIANPKVNESFKGFNISKDWLITMDQYPPLSIPFSTDYNITSKCKIICYQMINNIRMKYPMIYYFPIDGINHSIILGEGIWKWRMAEYNQEQSSKVFNDFIQKTTQLLKRTSKKTRLNVKVPYFNEEDSYIDIYAEYYNKSYELSTLTDIILNFTDSLGESFSKKMNPVGNHFELRLSPLYIGKYQFEVKAINQDDLFSSSGRFIVKTSQKEKVNTVANHDNLKRLTTKGESYYFKQLTTLKTKLLESASSKTKHHMEEKTMDLIHYHWMFFVLILIPFIEWVLRKKAGIV